MIMILICLLTVKSTQSAGGGAVEYTDCTFAAGWDPPPTSVLDMTLNNLMVRFQWYWSLQGMQSTPSLPLLPSPLWPGMVAPERALSMG